ncbi:hypothetical protein N0V93_000439 [Gnomoniopsis smithogilvyi]|uniref:Tyrosinase copper-binding domain-containing protein n=1 Tax=Gnomoniopsis smithogilvyi TaxID=1191159 RepID=A0A9W8Z280_9PEZI|nr:hypothetical protein N0V93_000439 [Gnomoniopsis smithogilvyi]
MWSSNLLLFAAVFFVEQAAVEALPLTGTDLIDIGKVVDAARYNVSNNLQTGIPSPMPLQAFGNFRTLPLEDVIQDPTLINSTTVPDNVSSSGSSIEESKLAEPELEDLSAVASCTSPQTRIEWRSYSSSQRQAFVNAIACLMNLPSAGSGFSPSTSRYEDFVRTHQKMTPKVHGNGIFILWHRYFVYTFEQALRTQCGFSQPFPWWDETKDSGKFHLSPLFTNQYFGSLPGPTQGSGTCIVDGQFANLTCHIGPGTSYVAHCLSRAVDESLTSESSTAYVNYCAGLSTTGSFGSCVETGPHAYGHNGIGSVMADVYSSPSDPIFFMHHLFIDHELWSWQQKNTAYTQAVTNACADSSSPCTNPVTLTTLLDMNGLRANANVGDILNTKGGVLCYKYDY